MRTPRVATCFLLLSLALFGTSLFAAYPQSRRQTDLTTVRVRYMVNDLDPAVAFYTKYLGFAIKQQNDPSGNPIELFQAAR